MNGALSGLARVVQVEHGHTGRGAGDAATELAAFGLRRVGVGLSINERARARANPTKCYPRVTNHSEEAVLRASARFPTSVGYCVKYHSPHDEKCPNLQTNETFAVVPAGLRCEPA